MRGRFIVLEGGEGTGKSTQAAMLADRIGAVLTREPGGTATGERIRSLLLDPNLPAVGERTEALLVLAARAQHVSELIEPALSAGHDVVCDRFSGSTLAYQGFGRGLGVQPLRSMSGWASAGLVPDAVILLVVDPALAAARLGRRPGGADRLEAEDRAFFDRVGAGFEALAEEEGWLRVDGDGTVTEVAARIDAALAARRAATASSPQA